MGIARIVAHIDRIMVPTIALAIPIPICGVFDSGVVMKYHVNEGIAENRICPSIAKKITAARIAALRQIKKNSFSSIILTRAVTLVYLQIVNR